jgi:integrase
MAAFDRLSRPALRKVSIGASIAQGGIVYTRLRSDGRWSINVMVNRVRHHIVVGLESEGFTRTQAEDVIAGLKAKKREQQHGVASPKHRVRHSVSQAAKAYLSYLEEHGGKDIEGKRGRFDRHITRLLGNVSVAKLTENDWSKYIATRSSEGAATGTINREQAALLHMLRTMVKRKELAAVPCMLSKGREPPSKLVYLTPAQTQTLIEAASNDQSVHALTFVMIAAYTGMRQAPILNLRARDVDCDRRVMWIGKDKAGQREQPIPTVLADYLRQLLKTMKPDSYVFASRRAKAGRLYQVNGIFARCVKRAKLPANITPHTMRHTMASTAAHAGLDAATIQGLGGWKTRAMAERYTHAANLANAMDTLEARMTGRTITRKLPRPSSKRA